MTDLEYWLWFADQGHGRITCHFDKEKREVCIRASGPINSTATHYMDIEANPNWQKWMIEVVKDLHARTTK